MQGQKARHWRDLCQQARVEQDPLKLLQLVSEIDQLLLENEERLRVQEQETKKQRAA